MKFKFPLMMIAILGGSPVFASDNEPQLPNFHKTLTQLLSLKETGGPGGSGNSKVEVVTILGNPSQPGPYAQLLKVSPNARIAPHHHSGDRVATVLSGVWYFGYGDKFDEANVSKLSQGSVYTEPSNAPHYAETKKVAVVILISGYGPTNTVYEDSANNPEKDKK